MPVDGIGCEQARMLRWPGTTWSSSS